MKTLLKYNLIIGLVLLSISVFAGDQQEKKKIVEKNYKVNATTKLRLENKFGKIKINSWEKNEFDIKVEVIGRGRSEERSQRILDAIDIDITEGSTEIVFETEFSNNKSKNGEGFEVNYTVYMPETNPLEIKNSFGDVTMGNRDNDLHVNVA